MSIEHTKKLRALEESAKRAFESVESVSCTPHYLQIHFSTAEAAKHVHLRIPFSMQHGKTVGCTRDALENRVPAHESDPKSWFLAAWDAAPWLGLLSSAATIAFYSAEWI